MIYSAEGGKSLIRISAKGAICHLDHKMEAPVTLKATKMKGNSFFCVKITKLIKKIIYIPKSYFKNGNLF